MLGFRVLGLALLAYTAFWVAAYRGLWYDGHVFARKSSAFEFNQGDFYVSGGKARILVFFVAPILLAAVCGACWEAALIVNQFRRLRHTVLLDTTRAGNSSSSNVVGGTGKETPGKQPKSRRLWTILHYNIRPLGEGTPWMTVGEVLALLGYVVLMITMVWQGVNFKVQEYSEQHSTGTGNSLIILKNVAKYTGFAAAIQFSIVLIPVSRDSKIWSTIGVPVERAVLYHTTLGHLAFVSLFLHGILYMAYYVQKHGWAYAVNSSFHYKGNGVNVPAGFIAGLCALPMWVLSLQFFRREYYRLFKTSHFLFIGVFGAGMVHYDGFVHYLLAGFVLYLVHAVYRLGNWNWWSVLRQCFCKSSARGCGDCALVHLEAGDGYTRLVLRNPSHHSPAKGGTFVFISVPALLGTIEAHPMSVALRGAPPHLWNAAFDDGVFTLYVKTMGSWTLALQKQESDNLTVHVDGLYGGAPSLASMKQAGFPRVVLFAGGSGVTSFTALIQDWCEAYSGGEDVPAVHLVWSCRSMSEIELLGEALPSFLAAAPAGAESLFKMSMFCSGKTGGDSPETVSWPIFKASEYLGHVHVNSTSHAVIDSLNNGVRTLIAGGGALAGWFWAENVAQGALLEGVAVLVLMTIVPASLLVVYGWISNLLIGVLMAKKPFRKRYSQLRETAADLDEPDVAVGSQGENMNRGGGGGRGARKTFPVSAGRMPVHEVLLSEQENASREGIDRVKVLVSGPGGMVDAVMTEARRISWKVFDVETASREL
ncbi:unnamed protein product [Ectocarpus sp. 12 AP-2014]